VSAVREKLCASAVALARAINYRGAGTLEYLYDDTPVKFVKVGMEQTLAARKNRADLLGKLRSALAKLGAIALFIGTPVAWAGMPHTCGCRPHFGDACCRRSKLIAATRQQPI
jgi:hypothetical protein